MSTLESFIVSFVRERVAEGGTGHDAGPQTRYRPALVGFADAAAPGFARLRETLHPPHWQPADLLAKARSVISFFLPFSEEVVEANQEHSRRVARDWALAYVETNALINQVSQELIALLAERGVRAATQPATHNFAPTTLVSRWSHKSVAAIAGLGSFGLHHMLITDAGCAGRFGSVVVDVALEPTSPAGGTLHHRCSYFTDGSCTVCVDRCPVGALTEEGLDKQLCYRWLQRVADRFHELGRADVCGKCATGPCALGPAA